MSQYFLLKNDVFGKQVAEYVGGIFQRYIESNYPTGEVKLLPMPGLVPVTGRELAKFVNRYYALKEQDLMRRTLGSSDFLPFSFLSKGLRSGAPVCLLLRQYTDSSVQEIFDAIRKNNYSTRELSNLLKIKDHKEFWKNYEFVSEALEKIDDMKTRLAEHIKREPLAVGTGFLVSKDHILTNHHVLPTASIAGDFIARFKYEIDSQGNELDFVDYKLDPVFYVSNGNDLDYAIIKIRPLDEQERKRIGVAFREAGNNFGWLRLLKEEDEAVAIPPIPCLKRTNFLPTAYREIKRLFEQAMSTMPASRVISPIIGENAWARSLRRDKVFQEALEPQVKDRLQVQGFMGQAVSIIQHPKGNRKEIVVYGNQVQAIYQNWIQYETDAEPGASGSPIFNSQWQLVGIHHSALIDAEEGQVVGYVGTRVCRIVEDLREQAKNPSIAELNDFLNQYVDDPRRGNIFISVGRKDNLRESADKDKVETDILLKLGSKIVEHIQLESQRENYGLTAIHIQQRSAETLSHGNKVIEWLQQYKKDYQPGDVALEILLDAAPQTEVFSDNEQPAQNVRENLRGAKVYYFRNRAERKLNAELVLKEYLRDAQQVDKNANREQQSYFPSQGAQPDTAVGRIAFCADVSMPSLVLYAGYVTNQQDRKLFNDQYLDQLAAGIARGVVSWANSLSPTVV